MGKTRNTNLDLLRIICMMMVVGIHAFGWGGLIEGALVPKSTNWYIGNVVYAFLLVAVNCFVLISGYFLCTAKFRFRKLITIWTQAAFYSIGVYMVIVCLRLGGNAFSLKELVKSAMVVTMDRYWFVTDYILLYVLSPLLNRLIDAMTQRVHLLWCCVLTAVFSVLPNLAYVVDFSGVNGGYSLIWFCVLYIVAAYFRRYVPDRQFGPRYCILVYVVLALIVSLERFAAHIITPYIFGRVVLSSFFYSYNSIVLFPCAVALFLFFRGIKIKNEKVNHLICGIAPLTFAVYLIHEQDYLRPIIWNWLNPSGFAQSPWMIPYMLICVVGIFVVCCLVEWCRQKLFRLFRIDQTVAAFSDKLQAKVENWLKTE